MNCFFVGLNTWTDKLPLGFFSVDQRTSARRAGSSATLLLLSWVAVALSTRLNFFTKSCALMSGSQLQRTTLGKKVLNRENWISHWRIKLKMEFKKDINWRDSCRWVNFMLYSDSSPKRTVMKLYMLDLHFNWKIYTEIISRNRKQNPKNHDPLKANFCWSRGWRWGCVSASHTQGV